MPFPDELDSLPTDKTNATVARDDHPSNHNNANAAINAIQEALGIDLVNVLSSVLPITLEAADPRDVVLTISARGEAGPRITVYGDGTLGFSAQAGGEDPVRFGIMETSAGKHDFFFTDDIRIQYPEDANPRVELADNARLSFGDGTNALDAHLYRIAAGVIGSDEVIARGSATGPRLSGDNVYAPGKIEAADDTAAETTIGAVGPSGEAAIEFNTTELYLDESGGAGNRRLMIRWGGGGTPQVVAEEP